MPRREVLEWEKELAGAYLSQHPLMDAMRDLADVTTAYAGQLEEEQPDQLVTVLGMVRRVRRHTTRRGDEMAFVTLEDLHGSCDVVVFPRVWVRTQGSWLPGRVVVVRGKVSFRRLPPSLICEWVKAPQEVVRPAAEPSPEPPSQRRSIQVTFRRTGDQATDFALLSAAHELLVSYPGEDHFAFVLLGGPNADRLLEFPNDTTSYCPELAAKLADLVGPDAIQVREEPKA